MHFKRFIITLFCLTTSIAPLPRLFTKWRYCCRKGKQIKEFRAAMYWEENCISLRTCQSNKGKRDTAVNLCSAFWFMSMQEKKVITLFWCCRVPSGILAAAFPQPHISREQIMEIMVYFYLLHITRHDVWATVGDRILPRHTFGLRKCCCKFLSVKDGLQRLDAGKFSHHLWASGSKPKDISCVHSECCSTHSSPSLPHPIVTVNVPNRVKLT